MKGRKTMKYKVITDGKRAEVNLDREDLIVLKHNHNKIVYSTRQAVAYAHANKLVNREIMTQRAHKIAHPPKALPKAKLNELKKTMLIFFREIAEKHEKANKIISSHLYGNIIKDIKSTSTLGILLYCHMTEEQVKDMMDGIAEML